MLAGLRLRDVLRRTSRLDAFGRDLWRWCAREHRSGELELGERYPFGKGDQRIDVSPILAKYSDPQRVEFDREENRRNGVHVGEERSRTPGELGRSHLGRCACSRLQGICDCLEVRLMFEEELLKRDDRLRLGRLSLIRWERHRERQSLTGFKVAPQLPTRELHRPGGASPLSKTPRAKPSARTMR